MDSEKVEWFAETVMGHVVDGPHYLFGECNLEWGSMDSLPRDLNAVYEPACRWLRQRKLRLVLQYSPRQYRTEWIHRASVFLPNRSPYKPEHRAFAPHPAEAIIGLCWEVGHG